MNLITKAAKQNTYEKSVFTAIAHLASSLKGKHRTDAFYPMASCNDSFYGTDLYFKILSNIPLLSDSLKIYWQFHKCCERSPFWNRNPDYHYYSPHPKKRARRRNTFLFSFAKKKLFKSFFTCRYRVDTSIYIRWHFYLFHSSTCYDTCS